MEEMVGQRMLTPISLQEFVTEYKPILENDLKEIEETMENLDLADLEQKCSLEKLCQDDDPYVSEYTPGLSEQNRILHAVLPESVFDLNTFKSMINYKKKSIRNPFKRIRESFKFVEAAKYADKTDIDIDNDLLIWVRIYRPARASHVGHGLEKPVFSQEFLCLGSNYLHELRDKIECICNGKRFFDISENPTQDLPTKDTDPAYFFITDTFYNDMRNPRNADYSEVIRNWARTAKGVNKLKFKVAKMEDTRFMDLKVSLGFPQHYQHHGNCEHIFIFSQVEVITPDMKCLARAQYPSLISFNLFNDRPCHMCGRHQYIFVVEGSDQQMHDPAYLCQNCFLSYHYVEGKKIGKFKAYRLKDLLVNDDEIVSNEEDNADEPSCSQVSKAKEKNSSKTKVITRKQAKKRKRADISKDLPDEPVEAAEKGNEDENEFIVHIPVGETNVSISQKSKQQMDISLEVSAANDNTHDLEPIPTELSNNDNNDYELIVEQVISEPNSQKISYKISPKILKTELHRSDAKLQF